MFAVVRMKDENCQTNFADPETVEAVLCSLVSRVDSQAVSDVFRVLSDPTRVLIIHALSLAPLCNCDIAAIVGLSESAVSHQMKDLRLMKLVNAERRGRMVYYSLADTHIRHILEDTLRHIQEDRP
jgi:DNA-binding transcriptional ArsR family regulator